MTTPISVTRTGPNVLAPVQSAIANAAGGRLVGEIRKAGQILKANPIGALVSDLIFTPPMADGTLDARRKF